MKAVPLQYQAEVDRVLSSENPAAEITYELIIGDESFIVRHEDDRAEVLEGDWGSSDGAALELSMEFAGLLPEELEGEEVRLISHVGEAQLPEFLGVGEIESGSDTKLTAVSSWQFVKDYSLEDGLEINNEDAAPLAYELLNKAPYRGRITVEPVDTPKTNRQEDRSVPEFSSIEEALEMVAEDSDMVFRDTATDGHVAGPRMTLSVLGQPVFTFEPGRHYDPDGGITIKKESKKVGRIVAWRSTEGNLGVEILADQIIDHDLTGFIEDIEIRDEEEPFLAAKRLVNESALHHRRGKYEIALDTLFVHPLIERDDWVVVIKEGRERKRSGLYRFTRSYLGFLTFHRGDLPEKTGKVGIEALKLSEELVKVERVSRISLTVQLPSIGVDSTGAVFIDTDLPWATVDGNVVEVDIAAAEANGVFFSDTEDPNVIEMVY